MKREIIASLVVVITLGANAPVAQKPSAAAELVVRPGDLIPATVEGTAAQLRVLSRGPDRLLLNVDYISRNSIKPASIAGNANLSIAGKRTFKGKNRPLDFEIGGLPQKGRAFWFFGAPPVTGDGTIGPWALPQSRVTLQFGAQDAASKRYDFPLFGTINTSSVTQHKETTFGMNVGFDLDDTGAYPVASAAAGAAIAGAYGGTLSGATWDVELLMGVTRPVRLMTLERPLVIGPVSMTRIAVRVRDRLDAAGRGAPIPDATDDPSEIIVSANKKGPRPYFTLSIPRATLAACSRLTFDKQARRIELWCRPT